MRASPRRLLAWAAWIPSVLGLWPMSSLAQDRARGALELSAPPECISDAELSATVALILERPVWIAPSEAQFIVRTAIDMIDMDTSHEWVVRIELVDPHERVIGRRQAHRRGGSCRSLDRMIAVIVAMIIDLPELETRLRLPPPEPEQELPPPARAAPPILAEEVSGSRQFELRIAVGGTVSLGLVPEIGAGGVLALALKPAVGWPAILLEARMLAPSEQHELGRGAAFTLMDAHLGLCPEFDVDIFRLGGCAGIGAGALWVTPFGFASAEAGFSSPLVTARAQAIGALLLRPLELRITVGIEVPLLHERFVRDRGTSLQTTIFEMAQVALISAIQLGLITDP